MPKAVTSFYGDATEQKTVSSFYDQPTSQQQTQRRQQQASQFMQTATPTLNLVQRSSFMPQQEKSSVVARAAKATPGAVKGGITSFFQKERERRSTQTIKEQAKTDLIQRPTKILTSPFRAVKWVAQAVGEGLSMAGKSVLEEVETRVRSLGPDTVDDARTKVREKNRFDSPWEEKLFGAKTTSYQQMGEEMDKFLKENNSPDWERKMLISTVPLLMFAADLSPYGKIRKTLPPKTIKALLDASDEATARKILTEIKLPSEAIEALAPRIPGVKTSTELTEAITKSLQGNVIRKTLDGTVTRRVATSDLKGVPTPKSALRLSKVEQRTLSKLPSANIDTMRSRIRSTVSDADAFRVAQNMGWTEERVLSLPIGTALNKEEAKAVSGVVARNLDALRALDKMIDALDPTDAATIGLRTQRAQQYSRTMRLAAVEDAVFSESARTLEAAKRATSALENHERSLLRTLNNPRVQPEAKDWLLKQLEGFKGDAGQMADLLRRVHGATLMEKIAEFATAMKLYAPSTHIVNTVTSALRLLTQTPLRVLSGGVNAMEAALRGTKRERFIAADLINQNVGMVSAWRESWRNTKKALMDEDFAFKHSLAIQDFTDMKGPAIKGQPWRNNKWDKFLDVFGTKVRYSFRALGVEDAMLRTPAFNAAITTEAGRDALRAGHKLGSREYKEHMARFMKEPPLEAVERAQYNAAEILFQEPLKGFNASINRLRNDYPIIKLVVPFYRTPVNLIRQGIQFSPLAPILPSSREALAGTAGQRADAIAKMILGTSMLIPLTMYAWEGKITGAAPKNPAERDKFFNAEGKQPYSVLVGGKWYPINRFAPFSDWFMTAVLIAQTFQNGDEKKMEHLISGAFLSYARNVLDKSYVKGLSDLLGAITDETEDSRNAGRYAGQFLAGATLPTGLGAVARAVDPVFREVDSIADAYYSRIPFLSKKLPARLDVYGFEVMRPGGFWSRLLSPSIPTVATVDIVTAELDKLGIAMNFPEKSFMGFPISDEAHREVRIAYGRLLYSTLNTLVTSPHWEEMSVPQREKAVRDIRADLVRAIRTKVATQNIILNQIAKDVAVAENLNSKEAKERAEEILLQLMEQQNEGI